MKEFNIGDIARAHYNSGTYIGKVLEDRGNGYLVEVLAVYKHPVQGDLHNPKQVEGIAFHERKALAFHEKMNAKKAAMFLYEDEVPEYSESLKSAVAVLRQKLQEEETDYNIKALEKIADLEEHYYNKIYIES